MERIINLKNKIEIKEKREIKTENKENRIQSEEKEKEGRARKEKEKQTGRGIEWSAPEHEYFNKTANWYWAVAIITLALSFSAIYFFNNIILGVLFLLIGFTVSLYGAKKPRIVKFSLTYQGLNIGAKFYPYEHLKSFWLDYDPPRRKELIIISKKLFMPKIVIPIADEDPNKIREFLIEVLKEEYQEPSLTEELARYLKF